jgi:hypothetical protein
MWSQLRLASILVAYYDSRMHVTASVRFRFGDDQLEVPSENPWTPFRPDQYLTHELYREAGSQNLS